MISIRLRPLYTRERPATHCAGGWFCIGAGLDSTENLASTGIRSLDRPGIPAANSSVPHQFKHGETSDHNSLYVINSHTTQQANAIHQSYFCFFLHSEGSRSRCYGRTTALRLFVLPYDEDEKQFSLPSFTSNGAPVE